MRYYNKIFTNILFKVSDIMIFENIKRDLKIVSNINIEKLFENVKSMHWVS